MIDDRILETLAELMATPTAPCVFKSLQRMGRQWLPVRLTTTPAPLRNARCVRRFHFQVDGKEETVFSLEEEAAISRGELVAEPS